ncbi:glucose-6-phosphate dehydrogenase [Amycolatopsis sp. SID8362]|uniref:glucose-6-phosphate dehydrogenase n=1 Tax=Amycolatopsis sp. SID8362 TaxID=2690346 RepID=UPI00136E46EB|nr:glucose-6-phosphate dehydrogenase [Amycolatopsis sp. SID8362]NBH03249.1 glucose-6-phosphate dehydrogenase [Amycolatopsis sp. SID8362]NED39950.1 glucose-6-phosphate dehydrogenase [Amycolatopsis sp. SID8362]
MPDWTAGALVIFGITGDLATKMTLPALYRLERRGALQCRVVGVASGDLPEADLTELARRAIEKSDVPFDEAVFARLARRMSYVGGDANDPRLYEALAAELAGIRRPLHYLALPPSLFAPVVERLSAAGLLADARVALEKPFGTDLESARELRARLRQVLDERQLLLVDHYLGKEPVIEIEYLRFANHVMAQLWDRDSVAAVQITTAEKLDVAGRGRFYDSVGTVRDVVQNHLLQLLALVAMDAPVDSGVADLRAKKLEVFKAIPAVEVRGCVRGQYEGYRAVPGVAADSDTETYVAIELAIDSWRWAGVPVFLRAGKCLPVTATEVRLILRHTPRLRFLPDAAQVEANQLVLRISPEPALRLRLSGLDGAGRWRPVRLDTTFERDLGTPESPYERLLADALAGDDRLFAWQDAVEESWRILRPLLAYPPPVKPYPAGTWGPPAADDLVAGHPAWQSPWLPGT